MSEDFVREDRYLVIKRRDIETYLPCKDDRVYLRHIGTAIETARKRDGKQPLRCVVIEDDWPEYEPTWQAIEHRMKKEADTGGGCSVCGHNPSVNVYGTYWLCGSCVLERITDNK